MDFESFVNEVKDNIKDYLPERFALANIEVRENQKLNETYTGLYVQEPGQVITPTLNLDQMYEAYENGTSMDELLGQSAELILRDPIEIDIRKLLDYDQAKENLFIRVSSVEANQDKLAMAPHKTYEDLAVTYHIAADIGGEGIASTMVTNQMLDTFGITAEQLHQDALANSENLFPARVESMGAVIRRMMGADMIASGMSQEDVDMMMDSMGIDDSNPMTVVSNDQSINGAAVLFYPGQMDKIAEQMQGDYFVLPSSTHEMLVIPDTGDFHHKELKAMVTEINATQVEPKDRLTDEVYHYDSKDRVFEKADKFADRQKMKAAEHDMGKDVAKTQPAQKPKHKSNDMSL